MATVNEKMKAIADAIRAKTGKTDPLTLDGMAAEIAAISGGGETPEIGTCELEVYYDGVANYFNFREEVICTMGDDGEIHCQINKVGNSSTFHANHPKAKCGSVYILGVDGAAVAGFECSGAESMSTICHDTAMAFQLTASPGEKATIRMYKNA